MNTNLFVNIFNIILYQPLFNALVLLYKYLPGNDLGIAIIVLTFLIKILFYPLGSKAIKSQKILSELQPKIKEIQEKYKNDKAGQTKTIMELYQREKINPFSGCLPVLVQLPILIALYRVFWRGLQPGQMTFLYSFISFSGTINPSFLGIINLAKPNLFLAILAGLLQFFQVKMNIPKIRPAKNKKSSFSDIFQKQTQYFSPIFTVLILFKLPSALGLYWVATTLFSIIQQYFIFKSRLKPVQNINNNQIKA